MSQIIYGASDDLIELRGDVEEEFNPSYAEPGFLALSTGDLLRFEYADDGVWTFRAAGLTPLSGYITVVPARGEDAGNDEDGCPGYSQKVVVDQDVRWVAIAQSVEIAKSK